MMLQVLRKSGFPALLVFLGALSQIAAQDVIISELMAVNNGTIEDEDGNGTLPSTLPVIADGSS